MNLKAKETPVNGTVEALGKAVRRFSFGNSQKLVMVPFLGLWCPSKRVWKECRPYRAVPAGLEECRLAEELAVASFA